MEQWDARPQLPVDNGGGNIVELESQRALHRHLHTLLDMAMSTTTPLSTIQQALHYAQTHYGHRFTVQLVRALQCDDQIKRQAVVWLLTQLNDATSVPQLQQLAHNKHLSRAVRLAASLALAGMGATREMTENRPHRPIYAIS